MTDQTIAELAPVIGTRAACAALGRSRATYYRYHRQSPPSPRPSRKRVPQPRALSLVERAEVLGVLHQERFVDQAPASVYANLLDEGRYLCSVPTMYRLLRTEDEVRERRRQATHPATVKPELLATGPNQVWSWDITKLLGPQKWTYFHLYVVIDIFSRYVVGWLLASRETAELAERLLAETIRKQNVVVDQLTIHADRGTSMASKPRHSSTAQSFLDGSAPSKMAARSASASSGGTTTNTDTPGSVSTPQAPSTSATPTASRSSANVCSEPRTPLTPNVLFAMRRSHRRYPGQHGSTNLWRSRQHSNYRADRSHQG